MDNKNKNTDDRENRRKMAAEARKANKPLMEKRRRERINNCLEQLKTILMDASKKESSYYSKLEKADILEMTVKYLKNLKRQQQPGPSTGDSSTMNKYVAGFNECTHEITRYLNSIQGISDETRRQMLSHLADSLHKCSNTSNLSSSVNTQRSSSDNMTPPIHIQPSIVAGSSTKNVCYINQGSVPSAVQTVQPTPMQLVPAKLPSGETIFVLASSSNVPVVGNNINIMPVMSNQPVQPIIPVTENDTSNKITESSWLVNSPMSSPLLHSTPVQLNKPSTISKSPDSCDDVFSYSRTDHLKSSPPLRTISDHNANVQSHCLSQYIMTSRCKTETISSNTEMQSSTSDSYPQFMVTPVQQEDSSLVHESVSSTSDMSLTSPMSSHTDRVFNVSPTQHHQRAESSQQEAEASYFHMDRSFPSASTSSGVIDPMWRPW